MKSIARVAIILFGIFWLVRGLSTCASTTTDFFKYQPIQENPGWLVGWLTTAGISAGSILLLSLLPALVLIVLSERIANRLFPATEAVQTVGAPTLYILGCTLLSFFFIIEGLASLLGGILSTISVFISEADVLRPSLLSSSAHMLGAGAVEALAGALLYRHATSQSRLPSVRNAA